jgi:hypothetical protein
MTTTTVPFMLTGDTLLKFVDERKDLIQRGELTRTDMILEAGYVYDNGKAMYTQFYTELLNARGIIPTTDTDKADEEYEDLSESEKDLYDKITEMLGEKWTHEETIEFMDELTNIGVVTASEFEDAFYGMNDEYHAESYFAEEFVNELEYGLKDSIVYAAIDWQAVWDHQLRYDFSTIQTVNGTFFFHNY